MVTLLGMVLASASVENGFGDQPSASEAGCSGAFIAACSEVFRASVETWVGRFGSPGAGNDSSALTTTKAFLLHLVT